MVMYQKRMQEIKETVHNIPESLEQCQFRDVGFPHFFRMVLEWLDCFNSWKMLDINQGINRDELFLKYRHDVQIFDTRKTLIPYLQDLAVSPGFSHVW